MNKRTLNYFYKDSILISVMILTFYCLTQLPSISKEDSVLYDRGQAVGDFGMPGRQPTGRRTMSKVLSAQELEKLGRWEESIKMREYDLLESPHYDSRRKELAKSLIRYSAYLRARNMKSESDRQLRRAAFVDPVIAPQFATVKKTKLTYPEIGASSTDIQLVNDISQLTNQLFAFPNDVSTRRILAVAYVRYGDILAKNTNNSDIASLQYRSAIFVDRCNTTALVKLGTELSIGPLVAPNAKSPLP